MEYLGTSQSSHRVLFPAEALYLPAVQPVQTVAPAIYTLSITHNSVQVFTSLYIKMTLLQALLITFICMYVCVFAFICMYVYMYVCIYIYRESVCKKQVDCLWKQICVYAICMYYV